MGDSLSTVDIVEWTHYDKMATRPICEAEHNWARLSHVTGTRRSRGGGAVTMTGYEPI